MYLSKRYLKDTLFRKEITIALSHLNISYNNSCFIKYLVNFQISLVVSSVSFKVQLFESRSKYGPFSENG